MTDFSLFLVTTLAVCFSGNGWLQYVSGNDWLQFVSGNDWLQFVSGYDWLQLVSGYSLFVTTSTVCFC